LLIDLAVRAISIRSIPKLGLLPLLHLDDLQRSSPNAGGRRGETELAEALVAVES